MLVFGWAEAAGLARLKAHPLSKPALERPERISPWAPIW
jgi:hypothetical protein